MPQQGKRLGGNSSCLEVYIVAESAAISFLLVVLLRTLGPGRSLWAFELTGLQVLGAGYWDARRPAAVVAEQSKRPGCETTERSKAPGGEEIRPDKRKIFAENLCAAAPIHVVAILDSVSRSRAHSRLAPSCPSTYFGSTGGLDAAAI